MTTFRAWAEGREREVPQLHPILSPESGGEADAPKEHQGAGGLNTGQTWATDAHSAELMLTAAS